MKTSHKRMKSSVEDLLDERRQMKTSVDKSKYFSLILEKRTRGSMMLLSL